MYGIRNDSAFGAMDTFEKSEGIDIVPAAGVAVAALVEAVRTGVVQKSETVLLNVTGGGEKRLLRDRKTYEVEPSFISKKVSEQEIGEQLCEALKRN